MTPFAELSHHPTVTTTPAGAQATCTCGWQSSVFRVVHGWAPGARDIEAAHARADHATHVREETPCPTSA